MTKPEAIALSETEWWKHVTPEEAFRFQINEPKLCMDFDAFHKCAEETLGRPVWTHEFAYPDMLRRELRGEVPTPTMDEIVAKIPEDKAVCIVTAPDGAPA